MSGIISLVIASVAISIPFIIIGLITERWFEESGYAPSNKWGIIIGVLFAVFLKQIKFPELPWWIYAPLILVGITLGLHRLDLWKTQKEGRFWWNPEKADSDKKQ